jgi:hypothetical protein
MNFFRPPGFVASGFQAFFLKNGQEQIKALYTRFDLLYRAFLKKGG